MLSAVYNITVMFSLDFLLLIHGVS